MALSNTTVNTLNTEYYDDFYEVANTSTGETTGTQKDFHRVLFRPKYGVQSRELTQLQTLLQKQLERLGSAQFRDGDRVVGGQLSLDTQVISGQVLSDTTLTNFFDRETNLGKYVLDSSANNTTKAHITQYVSADDNVTMRSWSMRKTTIRCWTVRIKAHPAPIVCVFVSRLTSIC